MDSTSDTERQAIAWKKTLQQIAKQQITTADTEGSYKSVIKIQITKQKKDNNPVG